MLINYKCCRSRAEPGPGPVFAAMKYNKASAYQLDTGNQLNWEHKGVFWALGKLKIVYEGKTGNKMPNNKRRDDRQQHTEQCFPLVVVGNFG